MPERIEMVVTEVTSYGSQRCVAGWDYHNERLVRPEPAPAQFWPALLCGERSTFHPGHVISFNGEKPDTSLPHRTEDWVVMTGSLMNHGALNSDTFRNACKISLRKSPAEVYGSHLRYRNGGAFIDEGTECGSLSAVEIPSSDLQLFEKHNLKGELRLRAGFIMDGQTLDLSVTAKDFRRSHWSGGLQAAKDLLQGANSLHIRLGLARAMQDGRCYLQVNGIYHADGTRDHPT